ncbi:MAG: hypothetical protein M1830_000011 [Pleopsidium flavum]|nr:MAG: hypothetical protein M1830_000011 [Pleopsidium flavum]
MSSRVPRDLSLLAAGEGSENPADAILALARGSADTDTTSESPEPSTGAARPSAPAAPDSDFQYKTLLHVLVGPSKKQVDVHRELTCNVSPYVDDLLSGKAKEVERKRVYHCRHNLQKLLVNKRKQPKPVELLAADGLLRKLETLSKLEYTSNITATRIHKVLKAAIRSIHVPSNDQWQLKKRMHLLLRMYRRCLAAAADEAADTSEDAENTIALPNSTPETFANFVRWLYQKKVESSKPTEKGTYPPLSPSELCNLYALADLLKIPSLQNRIADLLQSITPPASAFKDMITYISSHPTRGSKLFNLVVRMYAGRASAQEMRDAAGEWMGTQFLVELTALLLKDKEDKRAAWFPYVAEKCEFHVHDKKNPRCRDE